MACLRLRHLCGPLLGLLLVACKVTDTADATPEPPPAGSLAAAFVTSAATAGVPRDLLVAIAHVEDGLRVPRVRLVNEDDAIPTAGPMMLRHAKLNSLARGAVLVGATESDLRADSDRALTAGALVLAELGAKHAAGGDLASWAPALAELSGFADQAHRDAYVHRVFATLASGGTFDGRDAPITLDAHDVPPTLTFDLTTSLHLTAVQAQYCKATAVEMDCSKNKCDPTRNGQHVEMIVIHDTEAGWTSSVATLQNDTGKSVQYIVDTDGTIDQFVDPSVPDPENITAYHAGNRYYNERSVGIEHVGYATKPFPEAQYAASASLVDYLAKKYDVPRDRGHIIGHDQVPNLNKIAAGSPPCADSPAACEKGTAPYGGANRHTDPGVWEWPTYMERIQGTAKCNDAPSSWTCSTSTTARYQCTGDSLQVQACTGACSGDGACTAAPSTTPAVTTTTHVCEPVTATVPPVAILPTDAGADAGAAAPSKDDGGCSASPASRGGLPASFVPVAAALLFLARRRRRRHGPLDGMDAVVR